MTAVSTSPTTPDGEDLFQAAKAGEVSTIRELLAAGADPAWTQPETLITPLMMAAESGNPGAVSALLEAGAPWNAQDKDGHCAGEYASREAFHVLLEFAVHAEMILGTVARREKEKLSDANRPSNEEYLKSSLRYDDGRLLDADGEAVMMGWEKPLMERHADVLCGRTIEEAGTSDSGRDVLNIGFGLGIIDEEIQKRRPRSHTIIEAHPDV